MDVIKTKLAPVHSERYLNPELSWLEFNARVLSEAAVPTTPLLEKLKFLSIFSSNLDEFFMVRVAGLKKMVKEELRVSDAPDGLAGDLVLRSIRARVLELLTAHQNILHEHVAPELGKENMEIVRVKDLPDDVKEQLATYYRNQVHPVLTPLAVDPAHPFPFLTNLSVYLVVLFSAVPYDEAIANPPIGLVEVPSVLPRLIQVNWQPQKRQYVLLEDIVTENLGGLFLGFQVGSTLPIRVTRNLDYNLLENEVVDLLKSVQKEVTNREHQEAVRLEIAGGDLPKSVVHLLLRELDLTAEDVFSMQHPIHLPALMSLYQLPLPHLKDAPFNPRLPVQMVSNEDMFSLLAREDLLLHHPFDSFYPVVEFLQVAAHDAHVLAIKQTLYRTSGDSPIIDALITAAENGKQVTAVVELKARFDEKNNITWARRLERAGVNVVFGFVGLKTHCKATLVVRQEAGKIVRYTHLSTGNYNSSTAKQYTDLCLFTSSELIGADVTNMFNLLTGFNILSGESKIRRKLATPELKKISLSPLTIRPKLLELIGREMEFAKTKGKGQIIIKVNALVDKELIDKLYEASQAGVDIKLIVRGMCCLRPGVPSLSENISIVSVVDRFLEHSRIYFFNAGGTKELYLSSADMSPRNMDRRVEALFPVESADLKEVVLHDILETYLADNVKAWKLMPDGSYERKTPGKDPPLRAQQKFIELARDYGIKSLPYDVAIKHNTVREKGRRPVAKKKI